MWRDPALALRRLDQYLRCPAVSKVIVVDNDPGHRPPDVPYHPRLSMITLGRNIYVNPAWNLAVNLAHSELICLANDDIDVEADIMQWVSRQDWSGMNLLGICPDPRAQLAWIQPLELPGGQCMGDISNGFGQVMWLPRCLYRPVPDQFQIWFGDDWLARSLGRVSRLHTNQIHGRVSVTVNDPQVRQDIQDRIDQDLRHGLAFVAQA